MGRQDIPVRIGSWEVRPAGHLLILRSGDLKITVPFRDKADWLSLRLLTDMIRFLDSLLQKGGLVFRGLAHVKLTLKRLDGRRWLLSARGEVRYDVELTTEEALLMALAMYGAGLLIWPTSMDESILMRLGMKSMNMEEWLFTRCAAFEDIEDVMGHRLLALARLFDPCARLGPPIAWKRIVAAVIRDRLKKAEICQDGVVAFLRPRERYFVLTFARAGGSGLLGLLSRLSEVLGYDELRIRADVAAQLLIGEEPVEELLNRSEAAMRARRFLIREVFGTDVPEDGSAEVHIRNKYGRWTISLDDGCLELNGVHICIMQRGPRPYGVIQLPGIGRLELDETTARVLNAVAVALWPERVRDRALKKQIEEARRMTSFRGILGRVVGRLLRLLGVRAGKILALTARPSVL